MATLILQRYFPILKLEASIGRPAPVARPVLMMESALLRAGLSPLDLALLKAGLSPTSLAYSLAEPLQMTQGYWMERLYRCRDLAWR